MTTAPALAARGANAADTLAPGDDSTMSMPRKSKVSSACTSRTSSSPNDTCLPIERDEASATTSSAGKLALGEGGQHLAPDIAGRADHRYFETHLETPAGEFGIDGRLTYDAGRAYYKRSPAALSR